MKPVCLLLVLSAVLLAGCGSYPYNGTYGLMVVGNAAVERMHRAVSIHVCARPGTRLDDFERIIERAEHENGVEYVPPDSTNAIWRFQYQGKSTFYYGCFIREETPPLENSPAFSGNEILAPTELAAKVKSASDPVSSWLFDRFSENGRTAVGDVSARPADLKELLADELNEVVYGPLIYDETRFRGIALRPQTKHLVEWGPKFRGAPGELAMYHAGLNRALLEDVYPQELARKQTIPWTHHYIAIQK